MNNRKVVILLAIMALVVGNLFSASLISSPAATVNLIRNTAISKTDLDTEYQKYVDAGVQVTKEEVLDVMINDEVFLQGAERDGVRVTDNEVNQQINQTKAQMSQAAGQTISDQQFEQLLLAQTGMTYDQYKEALREQILVQKYLFQKKGAEMQKNLVAPTEKEISDFYRSNKQTFYSPENVKLAHVYIEKTGDVATDEANKKLLMDVASQISQKEITFEEAVQKYSEDEESKKVGGDIGWLTIDNQVARQGFGDEFVDTVLDMQTGEISGMLESNVGYHIVKVALHNDGKLLELDDRISPDDPTTVRNYIGQVLYMQKQNLVMQQALSDLIAELRSQARITIY